MNGDVPVVRFFDGVDEAEPHAALGLAPAGVERKGDVAGRDRDAVPPPRVGMDSEHHRHAVAGNRDAVGKATVECADLVAGADD